MKNTLNDKPTAMIPIANIHPFEGHPYQVRDDEEMAALTESIRDHGILSPLILRPLENTENEYELISGHRRFRAAQTAGIKEVPAVVVSVTREEAAIMLVDSNLHREHILPSEKAFAYKLKRDAMVHQGQTSPQLGEKQLTVEKIGADLGDSKNQVLRYIRLTSLHPNILQMVDTGKIALTPAVELSYLTPQQQSDLLETMECEDCTPSLSQAQQLKKLSQSGVLNMDMIFGLLRQPKANQAEKVSFAYSDLKRYFPKSFSPKDIQNEILKILEQRYRKRMNQKGIGDR